jgi:hypothetical protein
MGKEPLGTPLSKNFIDAPLPTLFLWSLQENSFLPPSKPQVFKAKMNGLRSRAVKNTQGLFLGRLLDSWLVVWAQMDPQGEEERGNESGRTERLGAINKIRRR